MSPTEYHHGDLESAFLKAAIVELESVGPAALSMRQVAKLLGVSHQAPYRHFSSKEALLHAIRNHGFRAIRTATMNAQKKHPRSQTKQLETATLAYVQFALANPGVYQLMFGPSSLFESEDRPISPEASDAFDSLALIFQSVGAPFSRETIRKTQLVWAMMHGIASLRLSGFLQKNAGSIQEVVQSACRIVWIGIA